MSDTSFTLDKLEVYNLSRELSRIAWKIYSSLDWKVKKITGDQFIESTDSVAANIAEGHGRFHYLERAKFLYNSRGSLLESKNWLEILDEREFLLDQSLKREYIITFEKLKPKLNNLIHSVYKNKKLSLSVHAQPLTHNS